MKIKSTTKRIIQMPDLHFTPDPRGMGYVFFEHMLQNKDKVAQTYGPTGEKDTYGNLLQRCVRIALSLTKLGLKPGDFISLCTFNHLDSCTPIIASLFIGAITAAVDPTLSLEDTANLLKQAPPKVIFVLPEAAEMIEKVISNLALDTKIVVFGSTEKHIPFSKLLQPRGEEDRFKPMEAANVRDTAMVFFTSGTSGFPKGICLNHFSMLAQFESFIRNGYCLDVMFSYASPYWTVFVFLLGVSIIKGTTRLVFPKFVSEEIWNIFRYKVTFMFLNTTQIISLLCQGRPTNVNISSLKDLTLGGGALKLDQMVAIKEMISEARVHSLYGQTEMPGPVTSFKPANPEDLVFIEKKLASCGRGVPGMSYKITDIETEEILGPNKEGELRIKTEFQLSGYHNRDSSEIWDSEGWLRTGDVAYYDDDCCFYIVDRIKEMFKFQSWHIAPAVVESVILTHPAVAMAVVIGVPHDLDGDHPMGIVVLKESHKNTTAREIEMYVEKIVQDRQRLRAGVKVLESFPVTASGKVDRRRIKSDALQDRSNICGV